MRSLALRIRFEGSNPFARAILSGNYLRTPVPGAKRLSITRSSAFGLSTRGAGPFPPRKLGCSSESCNSTLVGLG